MSSSSPIMLRRRLGAELKRRREESKLYIEHVAKHLECSSSRVSRIENGKAVARVRDVRDMLDMFDVHDDRTRQRLLALAEQAQQDGWWEQYEDVLSEGFDTYLGMETDAVSLRQYESRLVPSLLQTEDYARAVFRANRIGAGENEIDRLLQVHLTRQTNLYRNRQPVELWVVLDETALRRPVGGARVWGEQLARLADLPPNITIQVLPINKGAHAGLDGPFTIIGFAGPADQDVVYVGSQAGNTYLERSRDVRRCTLTFDHLRAAALDPAESTALVAAEARDHRL